MKILDRYILTSYLKTFISVFIILMLIFVLQAIWLYIKELAGKDLDMITVLKFLFYITPTLIPLILPLTILLASIMVFGNFAENYEFAAMKSTGISLQRAMSGLSVFIVLLAILTFFFSNNVIPWAQYNSFNLRKNIAKVKPAMMIAESQFTQVIDGFNIKVEKKSGERGQFLDGVMIHRGIKGKPGNYTTIVSKKGELASSENSNILKLILTDGYYYDDLPPKKPKDRLKHPFKKSSFETYTMNIDLSQINGANLDDKKYENKYNMLDVTDLNYTIDSLKTKQESIYTAFSKALYTRTNINTINAALEAKKDANYTGSILDLFTTSKKIQVLDYAINSSNSTNQIVNSKQAEIRIKRVTLNKHIIALHEKFALGVACIILFFVGAPLGALIRKGGIGLPMVIAIVLFLSYHFIGIFAKNSAKDNYLNPVVASWFSTLIMLPLSIFLTRRATADRGLFEFDHITVPIKKWYNKNYGNSLSAIKTKLIALNENEKKEILPKLANYKALSLMSIIFYSLAVLLFIFFFVCKNNKLEQVGTIFIQFSVIFGVLFLFYYIKANISFKQLYVSLTGSEYLKKNILFYSLGAITYPIIYINRLISTKQKKQSVHNLNYKSDFSLETPLTFTTEEQEIIKPLVKEYNQLSLYAIVFYSFAIVLFISYFIFNNNKLSQLASLSIQLSGFSLIIYSFYFIKANTSFLKLFSKINKKSKHKMPILIRFILYPVHYFKNKTKIKTNF